MTYDEKGEAERLIKFAENIMCRMVKAYNKPHWKEGESFGDISTDFEHFLSRARIFRGEAP